jgi:hypothetical protein
MNSIEIARYSYYLFSTRPDDDAVVYLYDSESTVVAELFFVHDGAPLPEAGQTHSGRYVLYYRRGVLPELIDMLRNERPVYLTWKDGESAALSTGFEMVGANESRMEAHARKK